VAEVAGRFTNQTKLGMKILSASLPTNPAPAAPLANGRQSRRSIAGFARRISPVDSWLKMETEKRLAAMRPA
jgi:hypothetical protein